MASGTSTRVVKCSSCNEVTVSVLGGGREVGVGGAHGFRHLVKCSSCNEATVSVLGEGREVGGGGTWLQAPPLGRL